MKFKRTITALITVAVLLGNVTFAHASRDTSTVKWSSSEQKAAYTILRADLDTYHYDSKLRYYLFEAADISVRVDKNCFYAHGLKSVKAELDKWAFNVEFEYESGEKVALDTLPLDVQYTLKGNSVTPYSAAVFNGTKEINDSIGENSVVFTTKSVGAFTVTSFEFTDVKNPKLWYYKYVNSCASLGILSGMGDGSFRPEKTVTRAELAVMIVKATSHFIDYRIDKSLSFSDVKSGKWYYDYIMKCASMGIVFGKGEGKFAPDDNATREEIAALTARVINIAGYYRGKPIPEITSAQELTKLYKDAPAVSNYAKKNVILCNKLGIMVGDSEGFRPKSNTTRAECARIFYELKNSLI